jgi:hypothetical protein
LLRKEKSSILFIVKRLQFVVNHIGSGFTMNGFDRPAVFTIAIADLIALAPWIPRSPAGFNFNGDGSSDRQPQFLAPPASRPPFFPERGYDSGAAAVRLTGVELARERFSRRGPVPCGWITCWAVRLLERRSRAAEGVFGEAFCDDFEGFV